MIATEDLDLFAIIRDVRIGVESCNMLDTKEVVSYQEFIDNLPKRMQEVFAKMPASISDAGAIINLFYSVTMHIRAGEATFNLSKNLITLLKSTDLPRFDLSILKLPYPAILVSLLDNPLVIDEKEIIYIYLTQTTERFRIVAGARDTSVVFVNLVIDPRLGIITIADAVDATIKKTLADVIAPRAEKLPVLQCMTFFSDSDVEGKEDKDVVITADKYKESRQKFFSYYHSIISLAINSALYITSPEADLVNSNMQELRRLNEKLRGLKAGLKKDNLERLLFLAKKRKIYIVGGGVKVNKEMDATFTAIGKQLALRHQVRGHWKDQTYGPRREQRKHIWIAPYWRGPSYAELLERNYVVK